MSLGSIYQYVGHRSPALSCDVTLSLEQQLALEHDPVLVLAMHDGFGHGTAGVVHWTSSVDSVQFFYTLPIDRARSTFYVKLVPRGLDLTRAGFFRFDLYEDQAATFAGAPLWTGIYEIRGFGYGIRVKRVEMSPACDAAACLAAGNTCDGDTCDGPAVTGATQPLADVDTQLRVTEPDL